MVMGRQVWVWSPCIRHMPLHTSCSNGSDIGSWSPSSMWRRRMKPLGSCKIHFEIHWHRNTGGLMKMLAMVRCHTGCRSIGNLWCQLGRYAWLRWQFHENDTAGGFKLALCHFMSRQSTTEFCLLGCFPLVNWYTGSCLLEACDPAVSRSHRGAFISLKFFSACSIPWAISKALVYGNAGSDSNFFCMPSLFIPQTRFTWPCVKSETLHHFQWWRAIVIC